MKKVFLVLFAFVLQLAFAQTVIVEKDLFVTGKRFATTSGTSGGVTYVTADSVSDIPLAYSGNNYPELSGQYPDSAKLAWYGSGTTNVDSVGLIFIVLAKLDAGAAYYTRTDMDSIKVKENDSKLITRSVYSPFGLLRVVTVLNSVNGAANKTQHISLGGAKLRLKLLLYYKRPG